MIVDWIVLIILMAIPAVLAFAGVALLLWRKPAAMAGGAALILVAGFIPLLLAYVVWLGVVGAVIGAIAAAARQWRRMAGASLAMAVAAVLVVGAEPVLVLNVRQVQIDESYGRCAGDKAIAAIQKSVAQGRGYPVDMAEVARFDGEYGDPDCYVSNDVNWLYRVAAPGTYTLGYWVDWRVTRRVCLHTAHSQGWSCGFEAWGPFKPGEVD